MITIHFQNQDIIIVEKPPHLLVHPNKKLNNDPHSLLDLVRDQTGMYLYPVHRIDRPVSGIVVFALKPKIASHLGENWSGDDVRKRYLTLVRGEYTEEGKLDFPLKHPTNGKYQEALTLYTPIIQFRGATLLSVEIKTGRFHQIRRHFARSVNHVLGDRTHGKGKYNNFYLENYQLERLFLHSHELILGEKLFGQEIKVVSPLPPDLQNVLDKLEQDNLKE